MSIRAFGRAVRQLSDAHIAQPLKGYLERRRADRKRLLAPAKLIHGDLLGALDCTIADMSMMGARVRVAKDAYVPKDVFLVHLREWTAYRARVAWRRGDGTLGLAFRSSHDLEGALTPKLKSMREYCVAFDDAQP